MTALHDPQESHPAEIKIGLDDLRVLELLPAVGLQPAELKTALVIWRMTAGFRRRSARMRLKTMAEKTGLSFSGTAHAVASLQQKGLISRSGGRVREWSLAGLPIWQGLQPCLNEQGCSNEQGCPAAKVAQTSTKGCSNEHAKVAQTSNSLPLEQENLRKEKSENSRQVFDLWVSLARRGKEGGGQHLKEHREFTRAIRGAVEGALGRYSLDELLRAVATYDRLTRAGRAPGWGRLTLSQFLQRSDRRYLDECLDAGFEGYGPGGDARPFTPRSPQRPERFVDEQGNVREAGR